MGSGNGLYSGFEKYRQLSNDEQENLLVQALQTGLIAFDTNVLLRLYSLPREVVNDIANISAAIGDRLFIPSQVQNEFWRNQPRALTSRTERRKQIIAALDKAKDSFDQDIKKWNDDVIAQSTSRIAPEELYRVIDEIKSTVSSTYKLETIPKASEDYVLQAIERIAEGHVANHLPDEKRRELIKEGNRRAELQIPPGYRDSSKIDSIREEGAAGDYILWAELLQEGTYRQLDAVLVTEDAKEDWWDLRGTPTIRSELAQEYYNATNGKNAYLISLVELLEHADLFSVSVDEKSLSQVESLENSSDASVPWTEEGVLSVIDRLDALGYQQGEVIREALDNNGRVDRARIYELTGRDEGRVLRGFTRPVRTVVRALTKEGVEGLGSEDLLNAGYDSGVQTTHFYVPNQVVRMFRDTSDSNQQ